MGHQRGRPNRSLVVEAIHVEMSVELRADRELGEEWVRFLVSTINRQLELGELVNNNGQIEVNHKGETHDSLCLLPV